MSAPSQKKIFGIFAKLKKRLGQGDISLNAYLDTIKQIIMELSPKEDHKYLEEYKKDKYSVGGLKPLPVPKNIQAFYRHLKIYFDPTKQLYYFGRPHKRSQGRLVNYKSLPRLTLLAQEFIAKRFFN